MGRPKEISLNTSVLGELKHLQWGNQGGYLYLREPPEVRSFVAGESSLHSLHPEVVGAALRYLASTREQCGQAPARMVSILSYSLVDVLADASPKGQASHGRLKRQLLLHNSDIICIQGLEPNGIGEGLLQTLVDDGYSYASAMEGVPGTAAVEANTIFWSTNRWQVVNKMECGAALAVDLQPLEDTSVVLRAICMRPAVPTTADTGFAPLFADRQDGNPVVVCADLSLLGGAEGYSMIEELADLLSVMVEITGEELAAPLGAYSPEGGMEGVAAEASFLNRLHRPDSLLFAGMVPIVALSGHTKQYLRTLDSEVLPQQFPAFRAPIVAAFDWHYSTASSHVASDGYNFPGGELQ